VIQKPISGKEAEEMIKKHGLAGLDISDRHIDIYLGNGMSIDFIPVATFELQIMLTTYLPTDILPDKIKKSKNKK
jgi:hypothetical protein